MKTVMAIVWWLLTLLTVLLILLGLSAVASGQVFPIIFFLLAAVLALPPLQPRLVSKLSFLKATVVRLLVWFMLMVAGTALFGSGSPMLTQINLCTTPQQDVCQEGQNLFVKDAEAIYLTAIPTRIPEGTPVKLELVYGSEPGKEAVLESLTQAVKLKDDVAQIELKPKTLPVGSYQLKMMLDLKGFVEKTASFTVWDSEKDVQARVAGDLQNSPTQFSNLILCDRSQNEPCKSDSSSFTSDMKVVGFMLDVNEARDNTNFRLIWKYLSRKSGEELVLSNSVKTIDQNTGGVDYTLTSEDGFIAGNYSLTIALESKNAVPIYREFSVK